MLTNSIFLTDQYRAGRVDDISASGRACVGAVYGFQQQLSLQRVAALNVLRILACLDTRVLADHTGA